MNLWDASDASDAQMQRRVDSSLRRRRRARATGLGPRRMERPAVPHVLVPVYRSDLHVRRPRSDALVDGRAAGSRGEREQPLGPLISAVVLLAIHGGLDLLVILAVRWASMGRMPKFVIERIVPGIADWSEPRSATRR